MEAKNSTDTDAPLWWFDENHYLNIAAQSSHVVLGYLGVVFNWIILHVLGKFDADQYRLMKVLAVADILASIKEILDSSWRITMQVQTLSGKENYHEVKVPRILCLACPVSHVTVISDALLQPVTVGIALDRVLATFKALWYKSNWHAGPKYSRKFARYLILGCMLLYVVPMYVCKLVNPNKEVGGRCIDDYEDKGLPLEGVEAVEWFMMKFKLAVRIYGAILAALLTIAAVIRGKALLSEFSAGNEADIIRKLNRTAAVVVFVNTVLVLTPIKLSTAQKHMQESLIPFTIDCVADALHALDYKGMWSKGSNGSGTGLFFDSMISSLFVANSTVNLGVLFLTSSDFRAKVRAVFSGEVTGKTTIKSTRIGPTTAN